MSERDDLIPEGTYTAVAYPVDTEEFGTTYVQFGESKNKGTPQVVVNTEICEGAGDVSGRRIAYIGYFPPDNADVSQRTIESLRYFGFKGNDLAAAITQTLDQKVQIVVEHEEYEGKWQAKIRWVNRHGGGALRLSVPMTKDNLKRFAAQMKSKVMMVPDAGGTKAASTGNGGRPAQVATSSGKHREVSAARGDQPPPPTDDDIPF